MTVLICDKTDLRFMPTPEGLKAIAMGLCSAGYVPTQCPNPSDTTTHLRELMCDSFEEVGQQSGLDVATNLTANLDAAAQ